MATSPRRRGDLVEICGVQSRFGVVKAINCLIGLPLRQTIFETFRLTFQKGAPQETSQNGAYYNAWPVSIRTASGPDPKKSNNSSCPVCFCQDIGEISHGNASLFRRPPPPSHRTK